MTSYNTGMPSWNQQSCGPFIHLLIFNKGCFRNRALVFESQCLVVTQAKHCIVLCVSITKSQSNLYWNRCIWWANSVSWAGPARFTGMARLTPCFLVKLSLCWSKGRADPLAEISVRATGISSAWLLIQTQQKLYKDTRHLSRASPIERGSQANSAGSLHINSFNSVIARQKLSWWLYSQKCLFSNARKIHDMTNFPLHRMSLDWVAKIYVFVQKTNRMVRSGIA